MRVMGASFLNSTAAPVRRLRISSVGHAVDESEVMIVIIDVYVFFTGVFQPVFEAQFRKTRQQSNYFPVAIGPAAFADEVLQEIHPVGRVLDVPFAGTNYL